MTPTLLFFIVVVLLAVISVVADQLIKPWLSKTSKPLLAILIICLGGIAAYAQDAIEKKKAPTIINISQPSFLIDGDSLSNTPTTSTDQQKAEIIPTTTTQTQSTISTSTFQDQANDRDNFPTLTPSSQTGSNILSVRKPTLNEIRIEKPISIWYAMINYFEQEDIETPSTVEYSGKVQTGTEYLFPIYWCTTNTDLLSQNMDQIETSFTVNNEVVPEKYVAEYSYDTSTGWKCDYHTIILGGWVKGSTYTIQIIRYLRSDLFDGQKHYPSGKYIYKLDLEAY